MEKPKRGQGMELVFRDINVSIGKRKILHDVCGVAHAGDMLAVMGPSGSGKTTLLNALAGRTNVESGEILANGQTITKRIRRKICYILQQDIFFPTLTLRDTLRYAALLRLPDKLSKKEKEARAMEIVDDLDLNKCLDTIIGDMFNRGLSGGEKKRANIACELLTDPELLLLDEPTSGLDSHLAFSLMTTLKRYTQEHNKTVITTIHQPSSQIFHMFDKVLLLCDGHVAFFDKGSKMLDHFASVGLHCAPQYNPADFMLEMVKGHPENVKKIIEAAYAARDGPDWPPELRDPNWKNADVKESPEVTKDSIPDKDTEIFGHEVIPYDHQTTSDSKMANGHVLTDKTELANGHVNPGLVNETALNSVFVVDHVGTDPSDVKIVGYVKRDPDSVEVTMDKTDRITPNREDRFTTDKKWPSSFWTQLTTLTARNFCKSTSTYLSKLDIIQALVLAVYCGIVWFQVPRTEKSINDRMGLMFFTVVFWGFAPLFMVIMNYPSERGVVRKERASGMYCLSAYYMAKMVSEAPLTIVMPVAFGTIIYWMADLSGATMFVPFLLALLLNAFTAQSLGIFLSILIEDLKTCITVVSIVMLSSMLIGGFYVKIVPFWLEWLKYLSFINHSFSLVLHLVFENSAPFTCAPANQTSFPQCIGTGNATMMLSGEEILAAGNVTDPMWLHIALLCGFLISFRVAGYMLLRYVRKPFKG